MFALLIYWHFSLIYDICYFQPHQVYEFQDEKTFLDNALVQKQEFLEKELDKLVDSTEQEDETTYFSLRTLELADYYFIQLKQTKTSDS